jgi:RNA polymerase sigma factor (sigma-70 family)
MPQETSLPALDETAWKDLVSRFDGRMWAVARACGLSATDAADAVQGAWLRLVESYDRIRDPDRIGAWLITTTRHEAIRLSRRARTEHPVELPDLGDPSVPDPSTAVVDAEYGRHVWARAATLDEPCRTLLRLFALNPDARYAQIAARMNMPLGSVGAARTRCESRLRALLEESP